MTKEQLIEWNTKNPVGSPCHVLQPSGHTHHSRTIGKAYPGPEEPLVPVHGEGPVPLCHVLIVEEPPTPYVDPTRQMLEWIWANCLVVYWPRQIASYPIEHNPRASKNARAMIEAEAAKMLK